MGHAWAHESSVQAKRASITGSENERSAAATINKVMNVRAHFHTHTQNIDIFPKYQKSHVSLLFTQRYNARAAELNI